MAKISGTVRLRPTRIALLVRPSQAHRAYVVAFARACTCLWGGRFNPIIPVTDVVPRVWRRQQHSLTGTALRDGYLRFFEPDVFVEAEDGLAKKCGIHADSIERRVVTLQDFLQRDDRNVSDFVFGLNLFDVLKFRYDRELQFVSRRKRRFARFERSARGHFLFEVAFGVFPDAPGLAYVRDAYVDACEPEMMPPTSASFTRVVQDRYVTPFDVGMYGLEPQYSDHHNPAIFIFDSSQTVDLIDYWNLSLFRRRVIPVELEWLDQLIPLIRDYITNNYRPLPGNNNGVMISTTVEFGRSIDEATAKHAREMITGVAPPSIEYDGLPRHSCAFKSWYDPIWSSYWRQGAVQPRRGAVTAASERFELSVDPGGRIAKVPTLAPEFARRFATGANDTRWANVLRLEDYSGSSEFAITYPPNVKNREFPRLRLGEQTIVSREGLVLLHEYASESTPLELLKHQEAIIRWLTLNGVSATPSAAGTNASEVVHTVGGLRQCALFAHEDTLKLLDEMAKSVHITTAGTVSQYADRTARVGQWKSVVSKREGSRFNRVSLETFTDKNVIRVGVAVRCPHCSQENWYDLKRLDYVVGCERCLREFAFPQGSLKYGSEDWRFRVVGPFTLPDYALGAYSTVLTLRALGYALRNGREPMTYSTGLNLEWGGRTAEVDFVAWYKQQAPFWLDPEPELVFGETKSFGTEVFHDKDIERLRALAIRFPGAYFVMATLKAKLGTPEVERLRKFAKWGRASHRDRMRAGVIVLTSVELFSEWQIARTWEGLGGPFARFAKGARVRLDDLWTLADVTQQLYLGLPSQDDVLRVRWQRKASKAATPAP